MEPQALVSVIIPVYRVETYLEKCLRSVLGQTYSRLEILVVDDGSPDGSLTVIRRLQQEDPRIRCIRKENGGLGSARNAGLRACRGDYVCFVDGDDWVRQDYVETLLRCARRDQSDVVICNIAYLFEDGRQRPRTPRISESRVITGREALRRQLIGREYKFHAPNKFCKTRLLRDNDLWFQEGKLYEDVFTTYRFLLCSRRVTLIPEALYCYRQNRPDSITGSGASLQKFSDLYEAMDRILRDPEIRALGAEKELQCFYVGNVISLTNDLWPLSITAPEEARAYYRALILADPHCTLLTEHIWTNDRLTGVQKLRSYLIACHFPAYCRAMVLLKKMLNRRQHENQTA